MHLNKTNESHDHDQVEYQIFTSRKSWANPDNLFHDRYQRAISRRFYIIVLGFTLAWIVLFYGLKPLVAFTLGLAGAYAIFVFMFYILVPVCVDLVKYTTEYLNGS